MKYDEGERFSMVGPQSLRETLRAATRKVHDTLDHGMAPLAAGVDYAAFLRIQYAARLSIEGWLAEQSLVACPPPQTHLIAKDLLDLNVSLPLPSTDFKPESEGEAWGVAWAIAGSSLGNRAILQRMRKAGVDGPFAFLGDAAMPHYWNALRPRLEIELENSATRIAIRGAERVFDQFLGCHAALFRKRAA